MRTSPIVQIVRYGLIAVIWGCLCLAGMFALGFVGTADRFLIALGIMAFLSAAYATHAILTHDAAPAVDAEKSVYGKYKNDFDVPPPSALLSDADIADLRAEYIQLMRERMYNEAETTSFEELLAGGDSRKRR